MNNEPQPLPIPTSRGLALCPCRGCGFVGVARTLDEAETALQWHLAYYVWLQTQGGEAA